jgi:hypothetical protein
MEPITDEFMGEMLAKAKPYSVVLLKATPKRQEPEADAIVWRQPFASSRWSSLHHLSGDR